MENLIYALFILVIVAAASYWLLRVHKKIQEALIDFNVELIASTNVDDCCQEIKKIPAANLKALSDKEKEKITDYLRYMIRGHIQLANLLASMDYYKLGAKKKKFITDYLFQALGIQGSAFILAEIIYSEALGVVENEKEKKFILSRCGKVLEFQEIVIKQLEEYKKSPLTKGYEALAIGRKIEKLITEFKS